MIQDTAIAKMADY